MIRRGSTIKVLDKGFVKLVDYMGSDERIAQAARVSYSGKGTKTVREDAALVDYLWRHGHTSPFEMVEVVFHEKMPLFVARQVIRHRTANVNEISGRYSILRDEFYVPPVQRLRKQSKNNKQGSSDELIKNPDWFVKFFEDEQKEAYKNYEGHLSTEMAKEVARINLPLSTYTEWIWKIDLNNLFKFLALRMDGHAQEEVRAYANAKYEMVKQLFPAACASFEKHSLNGRRFSQDEMQVLRALLPSKDQIREYLDTMGFKKSHAEELLAKL